MLEIDGITAGSNPSANVQPTTPTRASYRSPTKSSLARSHPHLASRTTRQGASGSRGKFLRDEILGKKSEVLSASGTVSQAPHPGAAPKGMGEATAAQADENRAEEQPHALQKEIGNTNDVESATIPRSPLRERQPAQANELRSRVFSEEPALPIFMPRLVERTDPVSLATSQVESNEPELPPTPVELGLSPAPERPRGLNSSSSPRGSKSGSGRRRQRIRPGVPATSSPLKQKAQAPQPENEAPESVPDAVDEALESEPEGPNENNDAIDDSAEIEEKQSTLHTLQERLSQLKQQNERLESSIETTRDLTREDLSLLSRISLESGVPRIQNTKSSDLEDVSRAYVTLFAPGNLHVSNRTTTYSVEGRTKIVHCITAAAPAPWLPNTFSCVLEVVVDASDVRVEELRLKDEVTGIRRAKSTKAEIYHWLNLRLKKPLHQLDVGGAVWGMGRWFAAAIERAKVFHRLDKLHGKIDEIDARGDELTQAKAITLAKYLDMGQIQLSDPDKENAARHRKQRRVMLVWNIELDWAGEVTSNIQIATSGMSSKAETGLKSIFLSLLSTKGVMGAVDSIRQTIHGQGGELELLGSQKGKRKRA